MKLDMTGATPDWPETKDWPKESDPEAFVDLAFGYARYVLAPPILAGRLRVLGDERASPRDFECECPVLAETNAPYCLYQRANCRFAGNGPSTLDDARKAIDDTASPSPAQGGPGKALQKIMSTSANQKLACELMARIARQFIHAPREERAAMTAEMEKAIRRRSRRDKAGVL